MNAEWAYIGIKYDYEHDYSIVFEDIYHMMNQYVDYLKNIHEWVTLEDFSLIKYPAYEMDGEKHNAFLLMKFKRIAEDGLDE